MPRSEREPGGREGIEIEANRPVKRRHDGTGARAHQFCNLKAAREERAQNADVCEPPNGAGAQQDAHRTIRPAARLFIHLEQSSCDTRPPGSDVPDWRAIR